MSIELPNGAKQKYQGELISVYTWPQKLFDGSLQTFETCIRPDTVGVIPFLDSETILLTRQEQSGREGSFFDVPGGRLDQGENFEQACLREMHEETGYLAQTLLHWETTTYGGLVQYQEAVYLAKDLQLDKLGIHCEACEKIEVVPTPWSRVVEMCLRQEIRRSQVALAILAMEFDPKARQRRQEFWRG